MSQASRFQPASPDGDGREATTPPVPAALVAQARGRPSSWVYEVDPNAGNGGPVSAAQIRRAWRTDAAGTILAGEYVDNPYYRAAEPPPRRRQGRRRGRRGRAALGLSMGVVALALAGVLVLALSGGSHSASVPAAGARPASAPMPGAGATARTQIRRAQARPASVHAPVVRHPTPRRRPVVPHLSLRAIAPVWVCVQDARGQVLVAGATLAPGQALPAVRGSEFHVFAGNGDFSLVVDGVAHRASGSPDPVAYLVRAGTVTELAGYPTQPCA